MSVTSASAGGRSIGLLARVRAHLPHRFQTANGALMLVLIAGLSYPAFRAISEALWSHGHFDFAAFSAFAHDANAVHAVPTTCFVVACEAAVSTIVGGTLAYLNERTDVRMGALTDIVPFLPFLLPAIAGSIGWVALLDPHAGFANTVIRHALGFVGVHLSSGPFNAYSMPALIFVYSIYGTPFAFLLISGGLRNIDPQLEEQSRMCGASRLRSFVKIVVPAMLPSITGAILLVMWTGFGAYAVPAAMAEPAGIHIMSTQIVQLLTYNFPPSYGPALVIAFIVIGFIGIALFTQRTIQRRGHHATTGGRGRAAVRISTGKWKWPIRVVVLAYMAVVVILPAVALLLVSLNGFWAPNINWHHLSFVHFYDVIFHNYTAKTAVKDSLELALIVPTIGIFVASIISVFVATHRSKKLLVADALLKLPVILPHLVLAIGFVLAFAGPPFGLGGSFWILLITFFFLFTPVATLTTDAIAGQVGKELAEASKISGASGLRTLARVYMPLMYSGMAVGWALIFVLVLGDVEMSSIVAGASNPTIGQTVLLLYSNGDFAGVASMALLLVLATSIIVSTVIVLARRKARFLLSADVGRAA